MLLSTNWSCLLTANVLLFFVLISFVFLIWNFFLIRFASWLPLKCDVLLDISLTFTLEMHWKVDQILFVGKSLSCRKFQFISVWFTWITSGRELKAGVPQINRPYSNISLISGKDGTQSKFVSLILKQSFARCVLHNFKDVQNINRKSLQPWRKAWGNARIRKRKGCWITRMY